eukprot:TRINITY_DN85_c0_g1_i5.p2 TRINITY_DN85_c0_g1~~TRINITY_DN85_c0_g1_i5.p2  ORF type:complete len:105 (-),score=21.99 TRINITY_DN85_c0_g1_i5:288-602(-)
MSQARLFLLAVCCVASVLSRSYPSPATAGCQDDSDCYGYGKICPRDFEMCVCNEHNICEGLEAYPNTSSCVPNTSSSVPYTSTKVPCSCPTTVPSPCSCSGVQP